MSKLKHRFIKPFLCLIILLLILSCKNKKTPNIGNNLNISITDTYILIEDKSFLPENFKKGFLDAHNKKLKIIFPDTTYRVTIGVGEQTKVDKILMVKKTLKKFNINKLDIRIR
jgi:beta-galactosidase beta subunit